MTVKMTDHQAAIVADIKANVSQFLAGWIKHQFEQGKIEQEVLDMLDGARNRIAK